MNISRVGHRRFLAAAVIGAFVLATPMAANAASPNGGSTRTGTANSLAPVVRHTADGPTGYEVTFRYRDPTAKQVQIKGEWYFANPYELSKLAGTSADDVVATPGTTPAGWKPGDIPIGSPNSSAANWPVVSMTQGKDGVWSYTTPLPSGVFTYGFFVDCTTADQTGCTEIPDPANPAWNVDSKGASTGSVEGVSQVYLPSDPRFNSADLGWQAPAAKPGTLKDVTYSAPLSTSPKGKNYLAVYTPAGYDKNRKQPYPTLYLHSGGSNELDWSTQGALGSILDNLIATGEIQPMVVVMPSAQGFPSDEYQSFDSTLTNQIVPYVQKNYNVSADASERAIGGLGYGASISNSVLVRDTAEFGYYGIMSPGLNADYLLPAASDLTAPQIAAVKKVSVFLGGGLQDPSHWFHATEAATLTSIGATPYVDYPNGGHSWYAWRILVKDFLTRAAFFPPAAG